MYKTVLTNFGTVIYEGPLLSEAKSKAKDAGFESTILLDNEVIGSYSPINGFRYHGLRVK